MSQFKPGDLALIAKQDHPENMFRVVELLFLVENEERYQTPDGVMTRNTSGVPVWIVSGEGLLHHNLAKGWHVAGWTQKATFNLMPLRGEFETEQQKSREVVE